MSVILAPYERRRQRADRCHLVGCLVGMVSVGLGFAGGAVVAMSVLAAAAVALIGLAWVLRYSSRRALLRDLDERIESSREHLGGDWGNAPGDHTRR